jgi:hypothetical protein
MRKLINPDAIARPASAYNHAMLIERPARMLYLSGQIGERPDGSISEDFGEQAQRAWPGLIPRFTAKRSASLFRPGLWSWSPGSASSNIWWRSRRWRRVEP